MADLHPGRQRSTGPKGLTTSDRQTAVQHWLKRATAGLPADLAAELREELEAHYQDALDAYVAEGLSILEAHQAVMDDLGASEDTAEGLRTVHLASRYYLAGLASATIYPICYVGFLVLLVFVGYSFVMEAVYYLIGILASTLIVFYCFHRLLANQISFQEETDYIAESLVAFGIGIICVNLFGFVGWTIFGTDVSILPWPGLVSVHSALMEQIVLLITDFGSLLVGIALLILGLRLAFRTAFDFPLIRVAGALLLVLGGVITLNTLNYLFDLFPEQVWYLSVVTEGLHLAVCGVVMIVFGQALLRERANVPLRTA